MLESTSWATLCEWCVKPKPPTWCETMQKPNLKSFHIAWWSVCVGKGLFSNMLPCSSPLFSASTQCMKTDLLCSWSPSGFFSPQWGLGAGWLAGGEASFTCDHNVLKFETFPHFLTGALTFVYFKNLVGCRRVDAVWKRAITDVSGTSPPYFPPNPPTHPSFLCLWDGAPPPPPLVLAHWFQALQKEAPQALILYMGAEKHFFALHCAQETKVFMFYLCRHSILM